MTYDDVVVPRRLIAELAEILEGPSQPQAPRHEAGDRGAVARTSPLEARPGRIPALETEIERVAGPQSDVAETGRMEIEAGESGGYSFCEPRGS